MRIYFNLLFVIIILLSTTLFGDSRYKQKENATELVVLIHGIKDSPFMMRRIEHYVYDRGYSVLNFDYESTKIPMDSIIIDLNDELSYVKSKYNNIYFVAHSLGSFVVRGYLKQNPGEKYSNTVLIAPPSKGSILAERFEDFPLFEWMFGEAGQKLGKGYDDYWREYPAPTIPFGIIAGGLGTKHGINPLIPGDDDGTVGVQETIIDGYQDFIIIPGLHSSLLWQDEVLEQTLYFIQHNQFKERKAETPIFEKS